MAGIISTLFTGVGAVIIGIFLGFVVALINRCNNLWNCETPRKMAETKKESITHFKIKFT